MVKVIIPYNKFFSKEFEYIIKYFLKIIKKFMKYYFIGICGISMSALAVLLKKCGYDVCGSDANTENALLEEEGIEVFHNKNFKKVKESDVVVFSSAIKKDNADLNFAVRLGKKIISRGELLGEIAKKYQKVIAVAGSHGKTTTTALIYNILKKRNPTLHLGGILKKEDSNFVCGGREYFVTEACEYFDNFLFLFPDIAVVTNIEPEHLDYFQTFENQLKSFEKFKRQSGRVFEGKSCYCAENIYHSKSGKLCFSLCYKFALQKLELSKYDKNYQKIYHKTQKKCKKTRKSAKKIIIKAKNSQKFQLNVAHKIRDLCVNICEDVNVENIIMAYRVAKFLQIPEDEIFFGIESFQGVKLRFEKMDCSMFKDVILDYAHHPTEIENTIQTAKKVFKNREITFIFQPHTYSRTKNLLSEFVDVLGSVENLVLFKTYEAREQESAGVSAKKLCEFLKNKPIYCENFNDLMTYFSHLNYHTVLVFVGAGDLPIILAKENFIF